MVIELFLAVGTAIGLAMLAMGVLMGGLDRLDRQSFGHLLGPLSGRARHASH